MGSGCIPGRTRLAGRIFQITFLAFLASVVLAGCGGGGGGSSITPPSSLSYSGSTSLTVGSAVSLTASVTGTVTTWSASPALPAGLSLNTSSGAIVGTPTAPAASAGYTITAANAGGSTTATVQLSVAYSTTDAANASAAKLTGSYDVSSGQVTLSWVDTFATATGYDVQQENSDGTWTTLATVAAGTAAQNTLSSTTSRIQATATYRVAAVLTGYSMTLNTAGSQQQIQVVPPTVAPTLVLGATQPIVVPTTVSVSGGQSYAEVDYALLTGVAAMPSISVGTSSVAPSYEVTFDPAVITAGTYQLQALLILSADVSFVVKQPVQTKPEITASVESNGTTGTVEIEVGANSDYGITQVSATLDGKALGTLTAPNCPCGGDVYEFPVDAFAAGSGPHTVVATITDGNGVVATLTLQVVFNNPPSINIVTPADGAIVYGTLNLSGTATTDKSGVAVTTTVTLYPGQQTSGGTQILSASTASLSASYDLSALTPGSYTLDVISVDATGMTATLLETITVASSSSLVYTPIMTLGSRAEMLAEDQAVFLYAPGDGTYHLHTGTSNTVLQNTPTSLAPINWRLTAGSAFADGLGGDRAGATSSVYQWSPTGVRTNLSTLGHSTGNNDSVIAAHDGWIVWASDSSSYEFYNLTTSQTSVIPTPAGAISIGNDNGDFFLAQGQLVFYYWAGISSAPSTADIFRWDQSSGTSTRITSDGTLSVFPQTDGLSVAWQSTPTSVTCQAPASSECQLNVENIATSSRQVLSETLQRFSLADGLLGWQEDAVTGGGVKVYDGTTTTVLSARLSAVLVGSSGGYVLYEDGSRLYAWSAAHGAQLLFDGIPKFAAISGSTVYLTNGQSQALYQVTLQ